MAIWHKLYYWGLGIILLLIMIGELVWLPDPLRWGTHFYWIDLIDLLIYAIALVPLLWMIAALLHLKASHSRNLKVFHGLISLVCLCSTVIVIAMPKKLAFSASALILSLLLILTDMVLHERRKRKVPRQSMIVIGVTLGLLLLMLWPTPYLVTYPGITLNMNRYAQAEGGSKHGDISGVLIFERPAFPMDWLYAKLFKDYTFEKIESLGMSIGEYNQEVRTMKEDANAAGSAIAFQKVGLGKGILPEGVRITAVLQNSQASEVLQPSDVITVLNGHPITMVQELSERMQVIKPGESIKLTVTRSGKKLEVTVPTRASTDDPKRASIGIMIANELRYDIPELVSYHNYLLHEGGPSHGAMLALTLIDQLTPCGVTYGHHVAGTGTIEPDGSIGPVGGLVQKAYTVSRTNADVFFVPIANEADARKGAGDLPIVPVRNLDDILNWLKANPKAGAPACST
ncbi:PDZ domain-containing protein [Paenibacillus qinlingensis]|uniref:PDZ domain-containing protein n=1 Tax=Paenibacillus qinlingensis TaxID=1837343 RepID=A0ABU1NQW2_9BACL|nr:PDZ domain-containing protein [Paenibacillus qinlingensis]MDR6549839.1 PDZ domain-containing protein [Paenibacillus qinlingensis]